MKGTFPIHKFRELETPFYYYDTNLLRHTLDTIRKEAGKYNKFCVHYAVKANANPKVLSIIRESGLGADCVSGGELRLDSRQTRLFMPESAKQMQKSTSDWIMTFSALTWNLFRNLKSLMNWLQPKVKSPEWPSASIRMWAHIRMPTLQPAWPKTNSVSA